MSKRCLIDIPHLPIGYKAKAYRLPKIGETILVNDGQVAEANELSCKVPWLIVEASNDRQTRKISSTEKQVSFYRGSVSSHAPKRVVEKR
jgi:hypothetical protein